MQGGKWRRWLYHSITSRDLRPLALFGVSRSFTEIRHLARSSGPNRYSICWGSWECTDRPTSKTSVGCKIWRGWRKLQVGREVRKKEFLTSTWRVSTSKVEKIRMVSYGLWKCTHLMRPPKRGLSSLDPCDKRLRKLHICSSNIRKNIKRV